ncbi:30S ribosome-binding factor RbfA [Tunicatimonas pelagia]|nr:30S ribosome-binding factor RbfA [Tunicatimonas pelagia]WKN46359.1 30S ribosome-binding factor RbfA [Tunicatimonas pelagia]
MKESKRQRQFSSLLQKELSEIFQRNGSSILGTTDFVTVSRVLISPDLGVAKIYLSFMLSKRKEQLMDTIQYRKGEIRRLLGNRIGKVARVVPELHFFLDDSADYAARMDKIISELDIPPAEENDEQ